jgi:uncharacterized protein (DUF302 family)
MEKGHGSSGSAGFPRGRAHVSRLDSHRTGAHGPGIRSGAFRALSSGVQSYTPGSAPFSHGYSLWFGTVLIFLGVVVSLLALVRYLRLLRLMRSGTGSFSKPSVLAILVAIFLAVLGVAMSYYLLSARPVSAPGMSRTQEVPMSAHPPVAAGNGIVRIESRHSVEETVAKLEEMLQANKVKLFATIDHSGEAEKAGLNMPNTKLLIFGSPKAGTPLMLAAPSTALDLPLKILVSEDTAGKVWVSYNSPKYLQERHQLAEDLLPNIGVIAALAGEAAK